MCTGKIKLFSKAVKNVHIKIARVYAATRTVTADSRAAFHVLAKLCRGIERSGEQGEGGREVEKGELRMTQTGVARK